MKKICLLVLLLSLFFMSCSLGGDNTSVYIESDEKRADNTLQQVISAVNTNDCAQLESLFSKNVRDNINGFRESSVSFVNFIQGDIVSFSDASEAGVGVDYKVEQGKKRKEMQSTFSVETESRKYYLAIRECIDDDFDNKNIGVVSIYIIDAENWKEDYLYRGDGKWSQGINIMQ